MIVNYCNQWSLISRRITPKKRNAKIYRVKQSLEKNSWIQELCRKAAWRIEKGKTLGIKLLSSLFVILKKTSVKKKKSMDENPSHQKSPSSTVVVYRSATAKRVKHSQHWTLSYSRSILKVQKFSTYFPLLFYSLLLLLGLSDPEP